MRKGILFTLMVVAISLSLSAQERANNEKDKVERPNYLGTFVLDFGLNKINNSRILEQTGVTNDSVDTNFENKLFGSSVIGVFYKYHLKIGGTGFSIDPAIGFSFNSIKYSNAIHALVQGTETIEVANWSDDNLFPNADLFKKSKLFLNYIEAPLELRYHFNKSNHQSSFWIGAGYKLGYLVGDPRSKVKYEIETKTKRYSSAEGINMQTLKQELTFRIGAGPFSAFYNYRLNGLFESGNTPLATNPEVHSFGISLANF